MADHTAVQPEEPSPDGPWTAGSAGVMTLLLVGLLATASLRLVVGIVQGCITLATENFDGATHTQALGAYIAQFSFAGDSTGAILAAGAAAVLWSFVHNRTENDYGDDEALRINRLAMWAVGVAWATLANAGAYALAIILTEWGHLQWDTIPRTFGLQLSYVALAAIAAAIVRTLQLQSMSLFGDPETSSHDAGSLAKDAESLSEG